MLGLIRKRVEKKENIIPLCKSIVTHTLNNACSSSLLIPRMIHYNWKMLRRTRWSEVGNCFLRGEQLSRLVFFRLEGQCKDMWERSAKSWGKGHQVKLWAARPRAYKMGYLCSGDQTWKNLFRRMWMQNISESSREDVGKVLKRHVVSFTNGQTTPSSGTLLT